MANSSHASTLLVLLLVSTAGWTSGEPWWSIMKTVTSEDVASKELKLSHKDVYDHVLPYMSRTVSTAIARGEKAAITVHDLTYPKSQRHYTKGIYLKKNKDAADTFQLEWGPIAGKWTPRVGERVGLFAEKKDGGKLNVKLFGRF